MEEKKQRLKQEPERGVGWAFTGEDVGKPPYGGTSSEPPACSRLLKPRELTHRVRERKTLFKDSLKILLLKKNDFFPLRLA